MRKFCYKRWVKTVAAILCVISFNVALGSLYAMVLGGSEGIYENTEEEFREQVYGRICSNYSVSAVAAYEDDFRMDELKDTNFRYGVIQTDDLGKFDLNDKSIYEVCNFDRDVAEDMLYIHSYSIGKNTDYYVGDSLLDSYYIYNGDGTYATEKNLIDGYYYVRDMDRFYCKADGKIYPVSEYSGEGYGEWLVPKQEEAAFESGQKTSYVWSDGQMALSFGGQIWYVSDIPVLLRKDLEDFGQIVSDNEADINYADYSIEGGYVMVYTDRLSDTKPYYVLSYVNEPIEDKDGFFGQNIFGKLENWEKQDYFVQADVLIGTIYGLRYGLFGIFAISGFLFLASFAIFLTGAGHRGSKEIVPGWLDKIPFDLFLIGIFTVAGIIIAIAVETLIRMSALMFVQFGILYAGFIEAVSLACIASTAVRIKKGAWWKNTVCWRIWDKFRNGIKDASRKIGSAVPLLWKAWIFMAILAFLEFAGLSATAYNPGTQVFLWFVEKAVLYILITFALLQMKTLQQAGEALAAGGLKSKLDTGRMFSDFRKHGENLNNIQEGIQHAVQEQMKSEHFKTELITNVSHDIKTPLTSIINYVDLLEKEEIDNQNVQEYIEVLGRQSARLKKLIEDLMEASKASTGNLNVVFERCDAHVMLTQTIGEFEEKLKAGQIELIVQGSDSPLFIYADPRHLWRIFDNMMNNICKYAQPSTRAYVNTEVSGKTGKIVFRNISKCALNISSEELLERFVRGDSSRNTEGSGLGLSIAQSLTELMKGTFELVIDGDLFKVIITFPTADAK